MSEILDYQENKVTGIPVFLKVLCILTFVGAGLGILGSIYNIFAFETSLKQLENTQRVFSEGKNPFGSFNGIAEATRKYGMFSYTLNLIGSLICLFAAILMWKLKKAGFYIYTFGEILPFIGSILLVSSIQTTNSGFMGTMSTLGVVISGIFSTAFIIMYAANLKHLK